MPPPFSQLFRKIGRDPSAESAGNEDLECGHGSSVLQTPTASGYQSSPSRLYLPETQKVLASTVPQTLTPSREFFSHVRYNGQHGSTAHLPLTPSGPSRVIGYLPRTICNDSSPFVGSTRLIIPFQPPQNACNEECMGNSGPQCRSTSISRTGSHKSLSPMSPFDPWKHGQALGRLEAHGSLKTVPSSQQEGGTLNGASVLCSGTPRRVCVEVEDHAGILRDSHTRQPESGTSADLYGTSDQQSGIDLSLPPIQYLPNTIYQPVVLDRGDPSKSSNLPYAPKVEDGQSFREALPSLKYPSPNAEANNSNQATQQALHRSQVLSKPHQVLSSKSTHGKPIVVDASPDLRSKSPSSGGISENGTVGNLARFSSTGTESSEKRRLMRDPVLEHRPQARTIVQSPMFEETDEYLWSPAPSDDGWEAPSAPHTPTPCHTPSDALRTPRTSGLASNSRGGLSRSLSYVNEHMHSLSGSPGDPGIVDRSLPHIDDLVPAGEIDLDSHSGFFSSSQHASTMGSRESSRILFRYSGIITDGASSRPISEIKLSKGVVHSLGNRDKTASRMPSSTNLGGQTSRHINPEQIHEEYEPNAGSEVFSLDLVQNPSADAGPGSSQTSSSLSTDRYGGDLSGHKARSEIHTLPTTRARCHTPPLLFGKVAVSGPEKPNTASSNAPGSTMGRFDQNPRTTRLKETGRLPKALYSLDEKDWETVSAETEARTHAFDSITFDTKTGSSLADNSDSGNLSLSKDMPYPFRSIKARPVMQHPAHPRRNYSFMLLKNSQTGDLVQVPQYEYASGGCLPNNNASSQLGSRILASSTYQHPSPLQAEHTHPFTSSSPISGENDRVVVQQSHLKTELSNLGLSEDVQGVKEKQTQNPIYKTTQDVLRIPKPAVNQSQHIMEYEELSPHSSTWFSTVSEVTSSEPSLPKNGDSLPKTKVWHVKGHRNGTPEQRVNQEVGSSLADADSLGANFLSSPVSLASSLIHVSDTPASLGQRLRKQAVQQDPEFNSQHILADFHESLAISLNREDLAISTSNAGTHSRSYSAGGLRLQYRKPSLRRSRSSGESHSRLMDLPSAQKASALNPLSSDSDAQQITSSGLLLRNPFLHSDENDSQYNHSQQNVIERRSHQPEAGDVSLDDLSTPSPTGSRPFMRDGVLRTDVPAPILHHPIYGRKGPWDRITPGPLRPRPHPEPLGPPLFQRPVARAESPHLHRIQHPPTTELLERHVLLSRLYLLPSMVVPPIALVYGHGYMDGLMRLHTTGEINGFRITEKTIALCWGYGLSAICIFAVVIVMIIIPASA